MCLCFNEMMCLVHGTLSGNAHVEDLELSDHEACPNDTHHGHGHAHDEHECGSDKKITGTQNKILQGEVIPVAFNCLCI